MSSGVALLTPGTLQAFPLRRPEFRVSRHVPNNCRAQNVGYAQGDMSPNARSPGVGPVVRRRRRRSPPRGGVVPPKRLVAGPPLALEPKQATFRRTAPEIEHVNALLRRPAHESPVE